MNTNTNEKLSRAESSRINGAQSKGPVSPEGKQRSSYNRTTHGMRSTRIVLSNESQQTYNELQSLFFDPFDPRDIFENECVSNIVNARWRIRRLEAADAANLELAIAEARPEFEKKYQNLNATHEHALAFRAIAQSAGQSDIMGRHEDRQHRVFERSYRLIAKHRGKSGALPSINALGEAESTLPEDNISPRNPMETEPDTQEKAFKPEPPPPTVIVTSSQPKSTKSEKPDEPRNPNCMYDDEFAGLRPLFDALEDRPDLQIAVSDALLEWKAKNKADLAA